MKSFKKWYIKNRKLAITLFTSLIIFIFLLIVIILVYKKLSPNKRESVYGSRCEITKNYPISDARKKDVKKFFNEYDYATFKMIDIKCNLIDIVIEVKDSTKLDDVKNMSKELLKVFDEEEINHYDLELMVESDKENSEIYPRIGTHHKKINDQTNESFVW